MNKNVIKTLSNFGDKVFKNCRKHSPEILAGCGIAGFIATTILACEATVKSVNQIKEATKDEPISTEHKFKLVWKNYIATSLTAAASITCIIGSVNTSKRRASALAAAYTLAEETAREYKNKVIETIGQKKSDEIENKIAQDKVDNSNPSVNIINNVLDKTAMSKTIPGTTLFYEPLTNTYFYADINEFKTAAINAREEETDGPEGYLGVVSWLCDLGISEFMPDDALAGWQATGWSCADQGGSVKISFKAVTAHKFNDMPCLMITYDKDPIPDYYLYYR